MSPSGFSFKFCIQFGYDGNLVSEESASFYVKYFKAKF